jgi:hypothetical protein
MKQAKSLAYLIATIITTERVPLKGGIVTSDHEPSKRTNDLQLKKFLQQDKSNKSNEE